MKKRVIAMLIAIAMLVALIPATGLADDSGFKSASGNNQNSGVSHPERAYVLDDNRAEFDSSSDHVDYTFGSNIVPSDATITGITVQLVARKSGRNYDGNAKFSVSLLDNGSSVGTKSTSALSGSFSTYTLGGSSDTWGHSWSDTAVNSIEARVQSSSYGKIYLDHIKIKVEYTLAAETYNVTYNANGAPGSPPEDNADYESGDPVQVLGAMTWGAGHSFEGWSDGSTTYQPGGSFDMPPHSVELTAVWQEVPSFTVTHHGANGAGQGGDHGDIVVSYEGSTPETLSDGETATFTYVQDGTLTISFAPDNGYAYWRHVENSGGPLKSNPRTITTDTCIDYGIHPQWRSSNLYQLTIIKDPPEGGTVTTNPIGADPEASFFTRNSWVYLTASENPGYTFTGFTGGNGHYYQGNYRVFMSSDKTVTAHWTETVETYNVTYDANGGNNPPSDIKEYEEGEEVTVLSDAGMTNPGFSFNGWKDGDGNEYEGTGSETFPMPAKPVTLTAQWETAYTLTINKVGSSSATNGSTVNPVSGSTFTPGTVVPLSATPNANSRFVGFYANLVPTSFGTTYSGRISPEQITMDEDKTIYALFSYLPYHFDHIDIEVEGSLTIEHKINGVTQSSESLDVTTSDITCSYTIGSTTTPVYGFSVSGNEWRALGLSFTWPDAVTITATLTAVGGSHAGEEYPFNHTFTGAEIAAAYAHCPGSESSHNKGFDFVLNAYDVENTITHDVTFKTSNPGGTIDGDYTDIDHTGVLDGTDMSTLVPALQADTGYTFAGWSPSLPTDVTDDGVYTATWEEDITYDVTFVASGPGSLTGNTSFTGIADGTNWGDAVTVPTPNPDTGAYFVGWTPSFPATVTESKTYTATFANKTPITLTANSDTVTYDSTLKTVTGFTGLPAGLTITGVSASGSGTNAGSYNVTFTTNDVHIFDVSEDVTDQYSVTYVNGTLTIDQKAATITIDSKSKTYGDVDPALTAVVTGTVGSEVLDYTLSRAAGEDVGTYAITAALGSNPNYDITVVDSVLTIDQKAATITIDSKSKTYGDVDPALTAVVTGTVGSEVLDYTLSRAAGEDVGTYAITAALGSNPNYDITVVDGVLTIDQKAATITIDSKSKTYGDVDPALTAVVTGTIGSEVLDYTLSRAAGEDVGTYAITAALGSNPNYDITVVDSVLTIDQKAATITIDNKSKTYGDVDPALTAVVTGTVGSEVLDYTLSRAAGEDVGTYAITAALGSNPNYDITVVDGVLTIDQKAATITIDSKSKTYGDVDPALTAVVTGTIGSEVLDYTLSRAAGEDVGTYAITAALGSNPNYDIAVVDGTLTIDQKAATITIDNKSKVFNDADPALTAVVTGTVGSEVLDYTLSRAAGEAVGTYAITATLGANPNYDITVVDGTLTIDQLLLTVSFFEADGTTQIGLTQSVAWDSAAALETAPVVLGSTFAGWALTGDNVTEVDSLTNVRENITAVATYTPITYTVTFVDFEGTTIGRDRVLYGEAATAPDVPARDGFEFSGWDVAFDNITRSITVTAQYTEVEELFTLSVTIVGEGSTDDISGPHVPGTVIDLTAVGVTPGEGYEFSGWEDVNGNAITDVTMDADTEVVAVFTETEVIVPEDVPEAGDPEPLADEPVPEAGPNNDWLWWLLMLIPLGLLLWLIFALWFAVVPIAEVITNNGDGTFTVQWGYENRKISKQEVEEEDSILSALLGKILSSTKKPPLEFEKGRVENVFSTVADKDSKIQWKIRNRKAKVDLTKQDK